MKRRLLRSKKLSVLFLLGSSLPWAVVPRRRTFAVVCLGLFVAVPFAPLSALAQAPAGPPFADGPDEPKLPPKPATRNWTVVKDAFTYQFAFQPGIPEAGKLTVVEMAGLEKPPVPDPKWGSTAPLVGAKFVVSLITPAGEIAERYVMHPVPLVDGKYALHLTPPGGGMYGLRVDGKLADGRKVQAEVKLPVDVWPLPKELEGTGDPGGAVRRRVVRKPVTN